MSSQSKPLDREMIAAFERHFGFAPTSLPSISVRNVEQQIVTAVLKQLHGRITRVENDMTLLANSKPDGSIEELRDIRKRLLEMETSKREIRYAYDAVADVARAAGFRVPE
jgi:hypothetical protein